MLMLLLQPLHLVLQLLRMLLLLLLLLSMLRMLCPLQHQVLPHARLLGRRQQMHAAEKLLRSLLREDGFWDMMPGSGEARAQSCATHRHIRVHVHTDVSVEAGFGWPKQASCDITITVSRQTSTPMSRSFGVLCDNAGMSATALDRALMGTLTLPSAYTILT